MSTHVVLFGTFFVLHKDMGGPSVSNYLLNFNKKKIIKLIILMHHTEVHIVAPEGGPIYPESQHDTKVQGVGGGVL